MLTRRAVAAYLLSVALCVAIQFTFWTVYAQASDSADLIATTVWNVLGWCQLAGLAIILVTTFGAKRRHDADPSSGDRQWLTASVLFYSALLVTLAFLPNWFGARWGQPPNEATFWMVWYVIDTVVPVLFTVEALRIWRSATR